MSERSSRCRIVWGDDRPAHRSEIGRDRDYNDKGAVNIKSIGLNRQIV